MQMGVVDRLSGDATDIHAEIIAVRAKVPIEDDPNCSDKLPDRRLFVAAQREVIGFMASWNDQCMTRRQRRGTAGLPGV